MTIFESTIYRDGGYLRKNPSWHEEDSPWKAAHVARLLARNGLAPRTVAEIGCGAGEVLNLLSRELGPAVACTGFDISPQAFELCRTKTRQHLQFRLSDMLLDDGAYFDVAMAIDVVEHVEDCYGFLRKLKARAEYKVLHIPLDLSAQTVLRGKPILHVRSEVGHIHYFTKDLALATLHDSGYEIVDHFYTCTRMELPHLPWQARLMKLPRRLAYAIHPDLAVRTLGGWSLMVLAR